MGREVILGILIIWNGVQGNFRYFTEMKWGTRSF